VDSTPPSELFDPDETDQALTTAREVLSILKALDQKGGELPLQSICSGHHVTNLQRQLHPHHCPIPLAQPELPANSPGRAETPP
jgi:hypothetical protein